MSLMQAENIKATDEKVEGLIDEFSASLEGTQETVQGLEGRCVCCECACIHVRL